VALVYSPLAETVLETAPKALLPKHAFVLRQLGSPPEIDRRMWAIVEKVSKSSGFQIVDAAGSTGGKDFLERILHLIRGTGFTIAIFSHKTRATALANIMLELGFAAMCGKPLVIVKSQAAQAPSDLARTDCIDYDEGQEAAFRAKLKQAAQEIKSLGDMENALLQVALEARSTDCAIAFERAIKGFLITGEHQFVEAARKLIERLDTVADDKRINDVERLRSDIRTFVHQAENARR
jgi:hypothetical protein